MRTVVQRVSRAEVRVAGESVARIGPGLVLLVGVEKGDGEADAQATAAKIAALRIFAGRTPLDRSVVDVQGSCLVVSQFTLAGSILKGNRPSLDGAEVPERAEALYLLVARSLAAAGIPVETGRFGASMDVDLVNDGPVTFLVHARGGRIAEEAR